jgi:hypothetical protein
LIFTLSFLKVVNLEAICTADCNTSINVDLNSYKSDYSSILRVGMAASIYLALLAKTILTYCLNHIKTYRNLSMDYL